MAAPRAPRRWLHPHFARAIRQHGVGRSAQACGFSAYTTVSEYLREPVPLTPLCLYRVRLLASVLRYEGELFADDEVPQRPEAFTPDNLPLPSLPLEPR